jgi:divalent metal cation (Fe/Co/Zn/Cd) transporter
VYCCVSVDSAPDPPIHPGHLLARALAGAVGFAGDWLAALVRSRAGRRLDSPALIADGDHARANTYVSLAVIASALAIANCSSERIARP